MLSNNQKLYVAGHCEGDQTDLALYATATRSHNTDHTLTCDAVEADTRIWLHANKSKGERVLVYSPDTDVMHIALLMVNPVIKDVCIQTNKLGKPRTYISIRKLLNALERDPDLAGIPQEERPKVLVSLYTLSGSDYTSFFVGHGKVSIMKAFFEHAQFVCEDSTEKPGSLANLNGGTGFYAFLRLIGAVYFRSHRPGFPQHDSPESLYNSLFQSDSTAKENHTQFIEKIRTVIWERVVIEDGLLPSIDALRRHYLRAVWTIGCWKQSTENKMNFPPILEHGWKLVNDKLAVDWESDENRQAIRDRVTFLVRGCACKQSKCINNKCSCHKNQKLCGPGCSCIGCHNSHCSQGRFECPLYHYLLIICPTSFQMSTQMMKKKQSGWKKR